MTFAVINVLKNSKEMIKMVKIQHTCDICEKITDTNRITTPILIMDNNGLGITNNDAGQISNRHVITFLIIFFI